MSDASKTQDKKAKKKKPPKSSEGKAKEKAEQPVKEEPAEDNQVKDETINENVPEITEEVPKDVPTDVGPETASKISESERKAPIEEPKTTEITESDKQKKVAKKKEEDLKLELEKLIELKEAFSLFDINHDGLIDLEDLKFTFASLGKPDMPEEQMKQMLAEMPDPVDFDAFVGLFGRKITDLDPEEVFTGALSNWDMQGNGMILEQRIKDDLQRFGDRFTPKEVDFALEEAPVYVKEGIAMIDYIKFGRNVCGLRNVRESRSYQKEMDKAGSS